MKRKPIIAGAITLTAALLSGCTKTTPDQRHAVYGNLAVPGQWLLANLSGFVHGYGWAIILLSVIVCIILTPVMLAQQKHMLKVQHKMVALMPKVHSLQKKIKAAKPAKAKDKLGDDMVKLYRSHDITLFNALGVWPLLVQLVVFSALCSSIQLMPVLHHSYFMGMNLGENVIESPAIAWLVPLIVLVMSLIQVYVSSKNIMKKQTTKQKAMMLFAPLIIVAIAIFSSMGLCLYLIITTLFMMCQTIWLTVKYFRHQ